MPAGASLTVEARAADTEAGLGSQAYVAVTNGVDFSMTGRFIQARVTFKPNDAGDSPILSNIRIQAKQLVSEGRVVGKGTVAKTSINELSFQVDASGTGVYFNFNGTKVKFNSTSVEHFNRVANVAGFDGTGTWNGAPGYTYVVRFVDNGSPGKNDAIDLVVRNPAGVVVFTTGGPKKLGTGSIFVT